uniref:ATP synthase complex subunit 8 n=1 Tax=Taeniopygia guttata TaxID=59729 RepID=Q27GW4_TAEGU|nr:ATP synthase F0 subunit 8 [Taeniopygia guttata]ABD62285.1 ATP synthase F0 subunit 8 [Taeniopygia guttata]ABD95495.1 ATP synthase F0 subunit 8 [Taeniopygia guttata]ABD95508.1 ATP synthase F0 subunit 8 [Taeniopygia guttata]ABD95521.1 ATP synthase F0 subunit 8 [Taeniopygia guttata]ABD95534.1 ATP synthase F0 subunit 8 [Taeniopygia guttata]
MPQLNPNPWLFIMLISWLTFSMIIQPKILTFVSANPPSNKVYSTPKTTPWTWPWT